jgi:lipocalin/ligand-binding SRPBCC domain-containing protein
VVSYGDIMRRYARLRGLRRLLVPVPVLTPRLSGMWLALVTPAQARIGRALVEGLRNTSVVRSDAAREAFAIEPRPLDAALTTAIDEAAGSHWKADTRSVTVSVPPAQAFAPIRQIGGRKGWYYGSLLWKTRARIDRLMGGIGMDGRRRDPHHCTVGDVIDGWTVDAYEPDGRMRLLAGMKLPGRGWLEFEVTPLDGGRRSRIRQTARFDPKGVLGRAYWYAVLPFHAVIFRGLLRRLAQLAEHGDHVNAAGVFIHRSVVPAPADAVFRWHERPEALLHLMPPGNWVRVEHREGGLRDGGRVTLAIGLGPFRFRWEARHYGYVRGKEFSDEQVRGPFRTWRHTHRMEAIGTSQTLYEDRVEYMLRGGVLMHRLFDRLLRRMLARAFEQRHRTVQASFSRFSRRRLACLAVLAFGAWLNSHAASAEEPPPVRTVESVDLQRYVGDWYEVARFPNRFQRRCVSDVRARYVVRSDGRLDVLNQCRTADGTIEARGVARVVDTRTSAKLKVRFAPAPLSFLPFVWGDYWILGLAADYSWAVVGSPDRNYLWILSRTRELPAPALAEALAAARANGFDTDRVVATDARRAD